VNQANQGSIGIKLSTKLIIKYQIHTYWQQMRQISVQAHAAGQLSGGICSVLTSLQQAEEDAEFIGYKLKC
jgi:hypothetical protein